MKRENTEIAPFRKEGRNVPLPFLLPHFPGREARAHARILKQRMVKVLRRHAKADPEAMHLAERMSRCAGFRPCRSAACPSCTRMTQLRWVARAQKRMAESGGRYFMATIVPPDLQTPPGSLGPETFHRLRTRVLTALNEAGIEEAFGGIDVSFNEGQPGPLRDAWQPHAVVFIPERFHAQMRRRSKFRMAFRPSEAVTRPVVAPLFDGNPRGMAYALKNTFTRRTTVNLILDDSLSKHRNTRNRKLRSAQYVELMMALRQSSPGLRYLSLKMM